MKHMSVGNRLYVGVIGIFALFAICMIALQQNREKRYKRDLQNEKLQTCNQLISQSIAHDVPTDSLCEELCKMTGFDNLRITLVTPKGEVKFDNVETDKSHMTNHLDRKEISQALSVGTGSDYDRMSSTLGEQYFYSATYFAKLGIVVRSALPYDEDLVNSLRADQHYLWISVVMLILLTLLLWNFLSRLSDNISKLRMFAWRADHNQELTDDEINRFPEDELGDIARRIVKLYKRLKDTKEEQMIMKRQLTQNVAHELKTPVASIHGYLETMLTNPNIDAQTHKQFMERCYAQAQRLSSLLQDISTLNRLDDSTSERQFESVDVSKTVNNICHETALMLQQRQMTMNNKLPEGIVINGNPSLIYSIFRNLTDNAIAYAGSGTTIEISARETQASWFFEFSDNGIGVEDCHLARLFERFYRVDKGRSRAMGGTGLGLAIVKNAVQLHGGTIGVCNRKGGGLMFTFSLRK